MNIYVISDLHGHSKAFFDMLNIIKFNDSDILYIIGDVMEYYNSPLEIIDYIRSKSNIILIKGNQEDIFINELNKIIELDYFINDNNSTKSFDNTIDIISRKGKEYAIELKDYLINLPYIKVVDKYILVHGDIILPKNHNKLSIDTILKLQNEHDCLYGRNFANNNNYIETHTVVLGHTIVMTLNRKNENILHKKGKILIDCGAAINKKLSCLRLNDLKEFYIEIKV